VWSRGFPRVVRVDRRASVTDDVHVWSSRRKGGLLEIKEGVIELLAHSHRNRSVQPMERSIRFAVARSGERPAGANPSARESRTVRGASETSTSIASGETASSERRGWGGVRCGRGAVWVGLKGAAVIPASGASGGTGDGVSRRGEARRRKDRSNPREPCEGDRREPSTGERRSREPSRLGLWRCSSRQQLRLTERLGLCDCSLR
jgi:hypothetical protein